MPRLSKRELEVLRLLAAGLSTQEIAETLTIRPLTARNHVSRLLTKLGVENRLQAVVYASRHRII
jgi:DNA-binding NarL/FixJ family response regulator